jgi:hypothetical protein
VKLRIAKKVTGCRTEDGGADPRYRDSTLGRALKRLQKTATDKYDQRWWDAMMATPEMRLYSAGLRFENVCDRTDSILRDWLTGVRT